MKKPIIEWSDRAKADLKEIYSHLLKTNSATTAQKIINEIATAPKAITFPTQYQFDDYIKDCRRIIIRNCKILYLEQQGLVSVVGVFDSRNNPLKMIF
jgi:plasmid stabilization system protein ParE